MHTNHPKRDDIRLESVLMAFANPLRLAAVWTIAQGDGYPSCSVLSHIPKSTMSHHWRILRDSGVVWQRQMGREYRLSLRRDDLDYRFPGLLDSILAPLTIDALTHNMIVAYNGEGQKVEI
ncbi:MULTISPECIES: helix-turn-helix transcriptional regulator [Acetobacteraceae]|uniref:ArsR family transcriptional regulator n=7 Tax=Acetobacteraceae TaxID=433 RepID=A0A252EDR5_9PROT|nr:MULTISPECIES: helix-turn-helix domain-containing protein [Acetobacteraceae]KAA8395918.1 helix-turn-helix transcriptional regulator [Acetobacter sp. DmW_125128]KFL91503.1 Transcriptional regulator, ArsR family [Acetobacter malorum]ASL40335.1 transcriptional regulator [Acetobacter oryzifermentans]ATJ91870.1 transcriptional regulator [Acetobacter tropicalis]KAA8384669.1 helix-turn-helix transcriptional regulator [Acetobacter tropicalis]